MQYFVRVAIEESNEREKYSKPLACSPKGLITYIYPLLP
jgi:hypothetical protein